MPDVLYLIEIMIDSYHRDSGRRPAGLLLGPAEYREFCYQMKRGPDYLRQAAVEEVLITEYKGYPVFVKELPGVELMISYQEAFHEAYR